MMHAGVALDLAIGGHPEEFCLRISGGGCNVDQLTVFLHLLADVLRCPALLVRSVFLYSSFRVMILMLRGMQVHVSQCN
jgi:hypothetical protein